MCKRFLDVAWQEGGNIPAQRSYFVGGNLSSPDHELAKAKGPLFSINGGPVEAGEWVGIIEQVAYRHGLAKPQPVPHTPPVRMDAAKFLPNDDRVVNVVTREEGHGRRRWVGGHECYEGGERVCNEDRFTCYWFELPLEE